MYFPIGWPNFVNLALPGETDCTINHICCDALKIIVAAISNNFLGLWYANPLIPITFYKRSEQKVQIQGQNKLIVWKPDSRQIAVLTNAGILLLYQVDFEAPESSVLAQVDSPAASLRRDSAELFIKENIPRLTLHEISCINVGSSITTICCISLTELLIANDKCELLRLLWSELDVQTTKEKAAAAGEQTRHQNVPVDIKKANGVFINLRHIPFYVTQNCHLKNLPAISDAAFIAALEYSPFIGGCAAVFSDRRAAFLIAMHLRFDEQNMHGFWVPDVEDATVCNVNHKFRLLAYGRMNSDINVYSIEDTTGGLELSHRLSINSNVMPGSLGKVCELKWSPDGCVLAVSWEHGGLALWSTFGALLMSTFNWDFGLHVDLLQHNPLQIRRIEWSTEGYQLMMITRPKTESQLNNNNNNNNNNSNQNANTIIMNFVKSTLAMNPCMTSHPYVLLQGDDTLYLNQGDNLEKIYGRTECTFPNNLKVNNTTSKVTLNASNDDNLEVKNTLDISSILSESKYWTVLQLPQTYAATNWPIRYSAINAAGTHIAVAGRTGFAHYSLLHKKWKLFGNESQEKDFVVSGGLLWWQGFIIMGCYSLLDRTDEIRCYPEECKLDNQYGNKFPVRAPVISLNMYQQQLIALTADGIISLFTLNKIATHQLNVDCVYEVDVKNICIHPACIVSLNVCNLRNDLTYKNNTSAAVAQNSSNNNETIIVNVCGRILMIQRDSRNSVVNALMASCLASCVECFWLSNSQQPSSPMNDCLWLYSGAHGMRMWLPILPPNHEQRNESTERLHTFMSKRIMLSFPLKLYPLVILFDNVIVLGVENETTLYASEAGAHFSLPFCLLERKSQVYLHRILRQLIKRNLGYSAWEIAKSCRSLPYFPHALELLLHEVLEEEATSKEPIPDALLPSILDFIREFPVYLQTIVQCARKTEIALWPYLFSMAGKPKDLFQQCLLSEELETAASYLIILQNLEPSIISKQYATLLLNIALQNRKWELAKDLIRFLKAIDPNEIDSPRSSMVVNLKIAPPPAQAQVNQNPEVFNLILGTIARERSFSNTNQTVKEKKDTLTSNVDNQSAGGSNAIVLRRKSEAQERREIFCIETVLQRHARKLLQQYKIIDLGYMCASLDFQLVSWLLQESERAAKLDDFVIALTALHAELQLPAPCAEQFIEDDDVDADDDEHLTLDYAQLQRQFLETRATQLHQASSQTSESGYFSLALLDTPTSVQHKQQEHLVVGKSRSNSAMSIDNKQAWRLRRLLSLQDETPIMQLDCTHEFDNNTTTKATNLPGKLALQIRYLLQLFLEAKCTDYALILSVLLQDAAAIGRIINVLIRSESLTTCTRIEHALKRLTLWSFDRECIYRSFMVSLQPYIYLLEQYVASNDKSTTGSNGNNVANGSVLSLNSVAVTNKLEQVEDCERLMENKHHDLHMGNGKVAWSLEAQRQNSVDGSLMNIEKAKGAQLSNGRRVSMSEHERKQSSATGCFIM